MQILIVTLCGSSRFRDEFARQYFEETLKGNIVLSIAPKQGRDLTEEEKLLVDRVYMRKIELSDEIRCINVGGYIGVSTKRELWYANWIGKNISWVEQNKALYVPDFFESWGAWERAANQAAHGGHIHRG